MRDVTWWYWFMTAILLGVWLAGSIHGLYALLTLTAVQVAHYRRRTGSAVSPAVQVRVAYLSLLLLGLWTPFHAVHWMQLVGTCVRLVFDYCALARALSLMPWNRRQPLTLRFVRRTFLTPPVRGNILRTLAGE